MDLYCPLKSEILAYDMSFSGLISGVDTFQGWSCIAKHTYIGTVRSGLNTGVASRLERVHRISYSLNFLFLTDEIIKIKQ